MRWLTQDHDSPYFVRFCKTPGAASLTATQAHRVAETDKDALDHDTAAEACQFLATLIMLQGVDQIPAEDVPALKSLMTAWGRRFRGRFAEETAERIQMILIGGR
jgi:tRNA G37 N-methylase TrmD